METVKQQEIEKRMVEVRYACSEAGWDGYDAEPVSLESQKAVMWLLPYLPDGLVMPDVSPDPNGKLDLEWSVGNEIDLVLSPDVNGRSFCYAGMVGCETFSGLGNIQEGLPLVVRDTLIKYFTYTGRLIRGLDT